MSTTTREKKPELKKSSKKSSKKPELNDFLIQLKNAEKNAENYSEKYEETDKDINDIILLEKRFLKLSNRSDMLTETQKQQFTFTEKDLQILSLNLQNCIKEEEEEDNEIIESLKKRYMTLISNEETSFDQFFDNETKIQANKTDILVSENLSGAINQISKNILSIKDIPVESKELIRDNLNEIKNIIIANNNQLRDEIREIRDENKENTRLILDAISSSINISSSTNISIKAETNSTINGIKSYAKEKAKQLIHHTFLFPFSVLNLFLFAPAGRGFRRIIGPFSALWDMIALSIIFLIFLGLCIKIHHNYPDVWNLIIETMLIIYNSVYGILKGTYDIIEPIIPEALELIKKDAINYLDMTKKYLHENLRHLYILITEFIKYSFKVILCSIGLGMFIDCSGIADGKRKSTRKSRKSRKSKRKSKRNSKRKSRKSKRKIEF